MPRRRILRAAAALVLAIFVTGAYATPASALTCEFVISGDNFLFNGLPNISSLSLSGITFRLNNDELPFASINDTSSYLGVSFEGWTRDLENFGRLFKVAAASHQLRDPKAANPLSNVTLVSFVLGLKRPVYYAQTKLGIGVGEFRVGYGFFEQIKDENVDFSALQGSPNREANVVRSNGVFSRLSVNVTTDSLTGDRFPVTLGLAKLGYMRSLWTWQPAELNDEALTGWVFGALSETSLMISTPSTQLATSSSASASSSGASSSGSLSSGPPSIPSGTSQQPPSASASPILP
jgi:hypothetical protein